MTPILSRKGVSGKAGAVQEADAAQRQLDASKQAAQAAQNQQAAQDGLNSALGQTVDSYAAIKAEIAKYGQAGVDIIEGMRQSALSFGDDMRNLDFAGKILEDAKSQAAAVDDLARKIQDAANTGQNLEWAANQATDAFNLLDAQHLDGLQNAIRSAAEKLRGLRSEIQGSNADLRGQLAQLNENTKAEENLRYQSQKTKLQEELNNAQKAGDLESIEQAKENLALADEYHAKRMTQIKQEQAAKAADERYQQEIDKRNAQIDLEQIQKRKGYEDRIAVLRAEIATLDAQRQAANARSDGNDELAAILEASTRAKAEQERAIEIAQNQRRNAEDHPAPPALPPMPTLPANPTTPSPASPDNQSSGGTTGGGGGAGGTLPGRYPGGDIGPQPYGGGDYRPGAFQPTYVPVEVHRHIFETPQGGRYQIDTTPDSGKLLMDMLRELELSAHVAGGYVQ